MNRACGHLAFAIREFGEAISRFEAVLEFFEGSNNRPQIAWFSSDCAEALLARDAPGDAARAAWLIERGIALAEDIGMPPLVERLDGLTARIGG